MVVLIESFYTYILDSISASLSTILLLIRQLTFSYDKMRLSFSILLFIPKACFWLNPSEFGLYSFHILELLAFLSCIAVKPLDFIYDFFRNSTNPNQVFLEFCQWQLYHFLFNR